MARTVNCVILRQEAEGLDWAPYPGDLGQRIYPGKTRLGGCQLFAKTLWQRLGKRGFDMAWVLRDARA